MQKMQVSCPSFFCMRWHFWDFGTTLAQSRALCVWQWTHLAWFAKKAAAIIEPCQSPRFCVHCYIVQKKTVWPDAGSHQTIQTQLTDSEDTDGTACILCQSEACGSKAYLPHWAATDNTLCTTGYMLRLQVRYPLKQKELGDLAHLSLLLAWTLWARMISQRDLLGTP